jgi:transposase-like protein
MSIGKDKKEIVDVQIPTSYVRASYALKRKIVDLISNGRISKNAAANKYNVSRSSIDYWMKKFSTLENKMVSMNQSDEIKKLKKLFVI